MSRKSEELKDAAEWLAIFFLVLFPLFGVVFCAFAAAGSDNPGKWLIRATCWLIVIVARSLSGQKE
jgi:protein-S-isoprenylcysteine O-methyltransferase Ste14